MGLIVKHIDRFGVDPKTNKRIINMAEIKKIEMAESGKDPFRVEEFQELVKLGYADGLNIKGQDEMFTQVESDTFVRAYRLQRVVMSLQAVNEQKRKGGK